MNWKIISRNIGFALLVSALFMFLSVVVSLLNGRDSALSALIISFVITFLVGIFPFIFVRKSSRITLMEGYVIITLSWLLSFLFGMLPYALWGGPFTLQNAWFESVSGYTTCGATILSNIESLPKSLLFWRASTHFIGGLGVVVFLFLIIPESSPMRMRLMNMELSSLSKGGYSTKTTKVVVIFAKVYLGMVLLCFICYMLAGMNAYDAICHAMSAISTGGFSTKNTSIGAFDSRMVELITMFFMFMSSLHFGVTYIAIISRSFKPFNNQVFKFFTLTVLIVAFVLSFGIMKQNPGQGWGQSMWDASFTTICMSSTTGFAKLDNADWPQWMMVLLMVASLVCGSMGSTCGGIKVDRMLILFKNVGRYINNILHPTSINEVRMGRKVIRDEDMYPHLMYMALYLMLVFVSCLVNSFIGLDLEDALFATISTVGNVGPASGDLGFMGCYNSLPMMTKLLFTMNMFLGRIEIYPVMAVMAMIFSRRSR